jgi:hypothetical protein
VSFAWVAHLRRQFFRSSKLFPRRRALRQPCPYLTESLDLQAFCVDFLAVLLGDIDKILID